MRSSSSKCHKIRITEPIMQSLDGPHPLVIKTEQKKSESFWIMFMLT